MVECCSALLCAASSAGDSVVDLLEAVEPKSYEHQAGGTIGLSSPDDFHVCKPCGERELLFYRNLPAPLFPFVPAFCGYAHSSAAVAGDGASLSAPAAELRACSFCRHSPPERRRALAAHTRRICDAPLPFPHRASPDALRRLQKARNLIVLQNLAAHCARPCVLDLKLGRRQHGDGAAPEKRATQLKRCAQSTSATLGVRLCGMRVYDESLGVYAVMDKYAGREMSAAELRESVRRFLLGSSGKHRLALCTQVLSKIDQLIAALERCEGLRLFGTSLLIIFDGAGDADIMAGTSHVEVCLVDFANATFPGLFEGDVVYIGADDGCLLGLSTLRSFIHSFIAQSA